MREVHGNSRCPCESGRRYAACCKRRLLKWVIDDDGEFCKEVPLVPEAVELLNEASENFRQVFEREPSSTDPIHLWKYVIGEDELERQTVEAMRLSGMRPHLIYAYQKTGGLIISRENEKLATTKDVQDWHAAIDEYFELEENPPEPHYVEVLFGLLEEELDSCIICLGYVLEHGREPGGARINSSSELFKADDYALICATKSMKTLRAIKSLLSANIGADALALARHLLENYFHIVYATVQPEMLKHVVDAQIGLKLGTHEFARNSKGRADSRRIIRKRDGSEFIGHISYHKMAESSRHTEDVELFEYVYSLLSEYTHPSFTGAALVLREPGTLDPLSNELQSEALFYSICFAAMILDELRQLHLFSDGAKSDIATVVKRVGAKAESFVAAMFQSAEPTKPFALLQERLKKLGRELSIPNLDSAPNPLQRGA